MEDHGGGGGVHGDPPLAYGLKVNYVSLFYFFIFFINIYFLEDCPTRYAYNGLSSIMYRYQLLTTMMGVAPTNINI